jgi:thioredoxin 1
MTVILCNRHNFDEEVTESDIPVVIYFWETLSGPSRALNLTFEEISGEYQNKVKFVKINSEENKPISTMFRVDQIPCIVVMKYGRELGRVTGFEPKLILKQKIDHILSRVM